MAFSDHEDVFVALGQRGGMEDNRYFVGRDDVMLRFVNCAKGDKRCPVWLYGSRRIGKSSIAKELSRKANESATEAIWVDATNIDNFNDLLEHAIGRFPDAANLSKITALQRFEELAQLSKKKPILVIFDEFDKVAITLGTAEQGFLRRLSEEYQYFTYIFITRLSPGLIIHEIPDMNSRLFGICNPGEIAPFKLSDISDVCGRIFHDIGCDCPKALPDLIWRYVGGFTIAVIDLVREAACEAVAGTLDAEDLPFVLGRAETSVAELLSSYWWDLRYVTRQFLIGDHGIDWVLEQNMLYELQYDGIIDRRKRINKPEWLVKVGKKNGLVRSIRSRKESHSESAVAKIHDLMAGVNDAGNLIDGRAPFKTGHEVLKYHHLTRPVCDEETFKEAIDHLYKVFFEGASQKTPEKREWRFKPQELTQMYGKSRVIGDITDLRCFFRHNQTKDSDSEKRNKSFQEAAEIFERICGVKCPSSNQHRRQILDYLLSEIIDLLENLLESYRVARTIPPKAGA